MSAIARPEVPHDAVAAMHGDLVEWGKVLLRGAKGDEPNESAREDDRPLVPKTYFEPKQERDAWDIDRLVRRLDPRAQSVLRTFYRAREPEFWHEYKDDEQARIEEDMCREYNYRWRIYCAQVGMIPVTMRGYHFRPVREAAVRQLCEMS